MDSTLTCLERVSEDDDPLAVRALGTEMVALFQRIGGMPDKLGWVCRTIGARLAAGGDAVLDRACITVADAIDAEPERFDRCPYHSRQHYAEVVLSAYLLGLFERLEAREAQLVVLAALIHDFGHDGSPRAAFEHERAALAGAMPLLQRAGVDEPAAARIAALVLATDVPVGTRYISQLLRAHDGQQHAPEAPRQAPELALLRDDPALLRSARLLCEADILPSIGLTLGHAMHLQTQLSLEWQRPLDVRDKLAFIDAVVVRGFLGELFLPNVHAIRHALRDSLDARPRD